MLLLYGGREAEVCTLLQNLREAACQTAEQRKQQAVFYD